VHTKVHKEVASSAQSGAISARVPWKPLHTFVRSCFLSGLFARVHLWQRMPRARSKAHDKPTPHAHEHAAKANVVPAEQRGSAQGHHLALLRLRFSQGVLALPCLRDKSARLHASVRGELASIPTPPVSLRGGSG